MADWLARERHCRYFSRLLHGLPASGQGSDSQRGKIVRVLPGATDPLYPRIKDVYLAVGGLCLLDRDDAVPRDAATEWMYGLYTHVVHSGSDALLGGFTGAPYDGRKFQTVDAPHRWVQPQLSMTYTALVTLLLLGDDLSRVNREAVGRFLSEMQREDGNFRAGLDAGEADVRFVYCACAIAHILGIWDAIDREAAVRYLLSCQSYEGGFGLRPGNESHGGSTYCAVASLFLLGASPRMEDRHSDAMRTELPEDCRTHLIDWLVRRQRLGFRGRAEKPDDVCYTFWIGASLCLLGWDSVVDQRRLTEFLSESQEELYGGFGRDPEHASDPLHSYMGIAGCAIFRLSGVPSLDAALGLPRAVSERHGLFVTPPPPPLALERAVSGSTR